MKKWIAVLAAIMMVLLCAAAPAENESETAPNETFSPLNTFNSSWVDSDSTIEVRPASPEGDQWEITILNFDKTVEWKYSCIYDAEKNALVSNADGENTKKIFTLNDEGAGITESTVYTDGAAVFSLDINGNLVWQDEKEDVGSGRTFEKAGWFLGGYACEGADGSQYELECFWDVEVTEDGEYSGYKVMINQYNGEETTSWNYSCVYLPETDTLSTLFGSKDYQGKIDEPITTVYDDGKAEFYFNDDGFLCWKDLNEGAGDGLYFVMSNG